MSQDQVNPVAGMQSQGGPKHWCMYLELNVCTSTMESESLSTHIQIEASKHNKRAKTVEIINKRPNLKKLL